MSAGVLRVGDEVIWRGSWGTAAPQRARVVGLQRTNVQRSKQGRDVDELPWAVVRANYAVADLDNHSWAYGDQLAPVPGREVTPVVAALAALEVAFPGTVRPAALAPVVRSISRDEAQVRGFVAGPAVAMCDWCGGPLGAGGVGCLACVVAR